MCIVLALAHDYVFDVCAPKLFLQNRFNEDCCGTFWRTSSAYNPEFRSALGTCYRFLYIRSAFRETVTTQYTSGKGVRCTEGTDIHSLHVVGDDNSLLIHVSTFSIHIIRFILLLFRECHLQLGKFIFFSRARRR